MQNYMETFLDFAVSMHGSQSAANTTTINVLHDEYSRCQREVSDLNNALLNANNLLENKQATIDIQTSEITDLNKTNIKLKDSLNSARLEIRKLMDENNSLIMSKLNFKVNTRYVRDNELSDISNGIGGQWNIDENEEQQDQQQPGGNDELIYIRAEKPFDTSNMQSG
jgi:chromosome segregation ATPase